MNILIADEKTCPCGSGRLCWDLFDARGIYCCKVCSKCMDKKKQRYRTEIFTNPNYDCDEPIDSD
jgi:hypothetical protein